MATEKGRQGGREEEDRVNDITGDASQVAR